MRIYLRALFAAAAATATSKPLFGAYMFIEAFQVVDKTLKWALLAFESWGEKN